MIRAQIVVFLAVCLAASGARAQEPAGDAELEMGVRLAQQGDFEGAIETLEPVARRLAVEGGQPHRLARAYVYLSISYLGLSQEQQAKAQFLEALQADRDIELSSSEFPPKVLQFFEEARREAVAAGRVPADGGATSLAVGTDVAPEPKPEPRPALHADPIIFRKVDFYQAVGEKEEQFDARLVLDPSAREIVISDEDEGEEKRLYARIPYDTIAELAYEKSAHRRWKTAILVTPFALFAKGKKHWLTIAFEGIESLPQNFVYLRLDKKNYRQILAALEAQTGIEPSITEEE